MRIISKIEIKNNYVVKGINFEGIRKVGDPELISKKYYDEGIDEIIFSDVVASLYQRNHLYDFIKKFSTKIFVPMTLGGGLRDVDGIHKALNSGADKVFFNSSILKNPKLIKKFSEIFGSQCIVISIEAKKIDGDYYCYYNSGRENSKKKISDWILETEDLGCGELLINSIDNDGTKQGFDLDLTQSVMKIAKRPVIISGGAGKIEDVLNLAKEFNPSGICLSTALHYQIFTIQKLKEKLKILNLKYVR